MTILEQIQQANDAIGIGVKQFRFADISEFNQFNLSFVFEDYPCHVVQPFTTSGVWLNGRTKTTVPINGWFLRRIATDTVNFRAAEIESNYMQPMRELAKAFIKNILSSSEADDLVDPEVDEVGFTIRPEYAFLKDHLFGVSYTIHLPVREGIC